VKICFMGLTGYQLLNGDRSTGVVGPDVYQVLLARELLKHGFQVAYINYDEGGPKTEIIDGIEVIKIYPMHNKLNIFQKAWAVGKAMRQANADIYFQQGGAGPFTPLFCRFLGRKCVMSIGHDAYVDPELRKDSGFAFNFKTALEIRLADRILVLGENQKTLLKENFGRNSTVAGIHTPLTPSGMPQKAQPPVVLWVGSITERKQPELFLNLAKSMPQMKFQMIGGSNRQEYVDEMKRKVEVIPNLEYMGFVPYDEINRYFSRASVFVSTSLSEGFPNVFIQAWMNYTPVVSLNIDPDDVISRHKLGFHSGTFENLVRDVRKLIEDRGLLRQMANNSRHYTEKNHDIREVAKKHIEVIKSLARKS